MNDRRLDHLIRLYSILDTLERNIGGAKTLAERMDWPKRGVYFFRETGENRSDTGTGPRIVRVGTHALKAGGSTTLWRRLSTHRGQMRSGGGNHRSSIFRLIVGTALIGRDGHKFPTWGEGNSAAKDIRAGEVELERAVSKVIGKLPFLWLSIGDEPGPDSLRGKIERNSIALLSNFSKARSIRRRRSGSGTTAIATASGSRASGTRTMSTKPTTRISWSIWRDSWRKWGKHDRRHSVRRQQIS